MTDMLEGERVGPTGPSDKEVVALLQRLASARAHLLQAEQAAGQVAVDNTPASRNDEIEEAHTELLWAQAQLITAQREQRAQKALDLAKQHEKQVLRRFGFNTFRDYLAERTSVPTTDVHLEFARREYEAAQNEWDMISQEVAIAEDAASPTIVLDLTGDDPRRIA
jgi:hypothetical protein